MISILSKMVLTTILYNCLMISVAVQPKMDILNKSSVAINRAEDTSVGAQLGTETHNGWHNIIKYDNRSDFGSNRKVNESNRLQGYPINYPYPISSNRKVNESNLKEEHINEPQIIEKKFVNFDLDKHIQSITPPVITENGGLVITVNDTKLIYYKAIPIARLPNINEFNGPDCMQPDVSHSFHSSLSRECLYVSVWTPTLNKSANLSVMVWIYALEAKGLMAYHLYGSADKEFFPHINYDGINIAQRNVVVVALHYDITTVHFDATTVRNIGFLRWANLGGGGGGGGWDYKISEAPGNGGLWDQVMALNWTRRNIANFGGNPNDITLFGETVGSFSISDLIVSNYASGQSTTPPVITENGAVIGLKRTVNLTTVNVFKGIPYAKPPIGDLRFRKTEPALNRSAIYVTTKEGSNCMQPKVLGVSEDCLYLNVWTPTLNTSANLSVMVWVNGGAFRNDAIPSKFINLDMSYLAQRNVVVVSFNYRLGVFGFLYGNSSEAPGNAGLWDQVMALNWTRRNIVNFGGNPNHITLFGLGSGSMSISDIIVSNASLGIRNWFNKAILLSGSAYLDLPTHNPEFAYKFARYYARNAFIDKQCKEKNQWIHSKNPDYVRLISPTEYTRYAQDFERRCAINAFNNRKCSDDNTWIQCLREKSAKDIINVQFPDIMLNATNFLPGTSHFTPLYGDVFSLIPYSANTAVKQGYFRQDLRILMNHNEMEGLFFAGFSGILDEKYSFNEHNPNQMNKSSASDVLNVLFKNYAFKQQVVKAFVEPFLGSDISGHLIRRSIAYVFGDFIIACPTVLFGAYITKWQSFTGRVYQTRFTYQSLSFNKKQWSNTTHFDDLFFIFGEPFANHSYSMPIGLSRPEYNSNDKLISNKMMELITHFAKTGEVILLNPSVYNTWPPYSVSNGYVNASYVELNPDHTRLGRVYTDRYRGNDGYFPKDIYNCFNFWDKYF